MRKKPSREDRRRRLLESASNIIPNADGIAIINLHYWTSKDVPDYDSADLRWVVGEFVKRGYVVYNGSIWKKDSKYLKEVKEMWRRIDKHETG